MSDKIFDILLMLVAKTIGILDARKAIFEFFQRSESKWEVFGPSDLGNLVTLVENYTGQEITYAMRGNQNTTFAKMIFAEYGIKFATLAEVGSHIGKDHSTVSHYKKGLSERTYVAYKASVGIDDEVVIAHLLSYY